MGEGAEKCAFNLLRLHIPGPRANLLPAPDWTQGFYAVAAAAAATACSAPSSASSTLTTLPGGHGGVEVGRSRGPGCHLPPRRRVVRLCAQVTAQGWQGPRSPHDLIAGRDNATPGSPRTSVGGVAEVDEVELLALPACGMTAAASSVWMAVTAAFVGLEPEPSRARGESKMKGGIRERDIRCHLVGLFSGSNSSSCTVPSSKRSQSNFIGLRIYSIF